MELHHKSQTNKTNAPVCANARPPGPDGIPFPASALRSLATTTWSNPIKSLHHTSYAQHNANAKTATTHTHSL